MRVIHPPRQIRRSLLLAATLIATLSATVTADADSQPITAGSIEEVQVDADLTHASVLDFSASYSGCEVEQAMFLACSWTAVAMLAPPAFTACPEDGLRGLPPGLPPISPTRLWYQSSDSDGTLHSGTQAVALDRVNDEHLCLYVNRGTREEGGPPTLLSELVASRLLHVDVPTPQPVAAPTLSFSEARLLFTRVLRRRFDWDRLERRKILCDERLASDRVRCPLVAWTEGSASFAGSSVVEWTSDGWAVDFRIVQYSKQCTDSRCRRIVIAVHHKSDAHVS